MIDQQEQEKTRACLYACMHACLRIAGVQLVGLVRAQEQASAHVVVKESALPPQHHPRRNGRELRQQFLDVRRRLLVAELHGARRLDRVAGLCTACEAKQSKAKRSVKSSILSLN